ncbi:MAG: AAA family ATPase [Pseudanabaena sp.]|jgi:predicted ATP-dependent endonuclease of OLD family
MHLQRVQVPDFRVLNDVDITFEKNFNPRVFPLGSQNGGGKSTLLQLIFVLLHCSTNPERIPALKNLLHGFDLLANTNERILTIIDIWDGEKIVQLEFFACTDSYIKEMLKNDGEEKNKLSFSIFSKLETVRNQILQFQNQEKDLKGIIEQFEMRNSETTPSGKFPDHLKTRLYNLGIEFEAINVDFLDPDSLSKIEKGAKTQLFNQHKKIREKSDTLLYLINELIEQLKLINIEYITVYSPDDMTSENYALLCRVNNLKIDVARQFLNKLSNKVFLTAPSTQVFLFLPKKSRKSLLSNMNEYYSFLTKYNAKLSGLFTYDFLAVDLLIESFKDARDTDFREAIETGEYGNSYKNLLKDLELLLQDKKVNLRADFSGLTFTKNISSITVELEPEDLSHGELKRLSVYVWLKHNNIKDAIVLMDEVDLALHPDWQYQIVSDLLDWVPSNQYILATHSYELCNALTPSHVKILEPKLTERRSD